MEIKNIVDGKIVSINGKPVQEIDYFNNIDVVEPISNEEIKLEESANTETESGRDEE
jgi:hypothetical protein